MAQWVQLPHPASRQGFSMNYEKALAENCEERPTNEVLMIACQASRQLRVVGSPSGKEEAARVLRAATVSLKKRKAFLLCLKGSE